MGSGVVVARHYVDGPIRYCHCAFVGQEEGGGEARKLSSRFRDLPPCFTVEAGGFIFGILFVSSAIMRGTIFVQVWNVMIHFKKVTFHHIPRERNKERDRMVNDALDRHIVTK